MKLKKTKYFIMATESLTIKIHWTEQGDTTSFHSCKIHTDEKAVTLLEVIQGISNSDAYREYY